jgi:hypothetical protein
MSQDPLDAAKHWVDDEVGLESLLTSNSSLGYPLGSMAHPSMDSGGDGNAPSAGQE